MSSLKKFLKFQKNFATTGSTGDTSGGASYFTPTFSDTGPAKKRKVHNATHELTKDDSFTEDDDTVFVSRNTAKYAFGKEKEKLKSSSGIARVGRWQDDHSPAMGVHKAYGEEHRGIKKVSPNKRRLLNQGSMGTSGKTMSTTPDNSHTTTLVGKDDGTRFNIVLSTDYVTDLIKWVTMELKKEGDPYGVRRLKNDDPSKPLRDGDINLKRNGKKSPTTEVTVPATGASMGTPGGLEASSRVSFPQSEDPSTMVDSRLAEKGRVRVKKPVDPTRQGAYLAQPNQAGYNFNAMEKGIAGGGAPHVFSIVQPIHGGEQDQTKKYIEGESEIEEHNTQDTVEERMKEKQNRDKKDKEPGMDGPGIDDAGAVMGTIGGSISQFMVKQGFDYEADALHRGGTQDKEDYEPTVDDESDKKEEDEYYAEEFLKQEKTKNARIFYEKFLKGEITFDTDISE